VGVTEPAYRVLAEALAEGIRAGEYPIGSKLPSINELAESNESTPGVARDALVWLVEKGWADSRHGAGYRVTAIPPPPPESERSWREALEARVAALESWRAQVERRPPD
jgi:DNA-binding GntR family transcriptional regulator